MDAGVVEEVEAVALHQLDAFVPTKQLNLSGEAKSNSLCLRFGLVDRSLRDGVLQQRVVARERDPVDRAEFKYFGDLALERKVAYLVVHNQLAVYPLKQKSLQVLVSCITQGKAHV